MQRCRPDKSKPDRDQSTLGLGHCFGERLPDAPERFSFLLDATQIQLQPTPAHHVERPPIDALDLQRIVHHDQSTAARTRLPDMSPLTVAGKHNPRLFTDNLRLMNVPKGPVAIPFVTQVLHGARGVGVVPRAPGETGVKKPQIELSRHGHRVVGSQILRNGPVRKPAAMNHRRMSRNLHRFRGAGRKHIDVVRQAQFPGNHRSGIVIAGNQVNRKTFVLESGHLPAEK